MRRFLAVIVVSGMLAIGATPAAATFPGSNGRIAFVTSFHHHHYIGAIDPDGTDHTRLTSVRSRDDWDPAWSADGTGIVFVAYRTTSKIHTVAADGSGDTIVYVAPRRIHDVARPVWSPDGTKIAFDALVGNGFSNRKIFVMNADGSSVASISPPRAGDNAPDWSPDGTEIAFRSGAKLMTMDADGSNRQRLGDRRGFYPSWSPDGNQIVFGSFSCDIYIIDADGTNETQITDTDRRECDPVFSPDGTELAFSGHGDLFVLTLADDSVVRLAPHSPAHEFEPDWQPIT